MAGAFDDGLREHPDLVRKVTSTYGRQQRAANRAQREAGAGAETSTAATEGAE